MKAWQICVPLLALAAAFTVANGMRKPATVPVKAAKPVRQVAMAAQPIARKEQLAVAFRLDPELTHGMYLGDRWVSPPSYFFAQQGRQYVVQAKAQNINTRGERTDLSGNWAPDDPEMVAVTQRKAGEVTIVVRRPGESNLSVSTGDGVKVLHIRARQVGEAMQVNITQ